MKTGRFRPAERLKTTSDFKRVFENPRRLSGKTLLMLFSTPQQGHARLGVVTGKRVSRKAVCRNRIRRIVRESFRIKGKKISSLDIVVIARQGCAQLDRIALRKEMDALWEKLKSNLQKYPVS